MNETEDDVAVITGLTETHIKEDKFLWDKRYSKYEQRRERKDKKGGGLLLMHKSNKYIKFDQSQENNKDILVVNGQVGLDKMKIILTYLATGNNNASKERNKNIKERIETLLNDSSDDENLILMGDFNGHLGLIGKQKEDENGKIVKELSNKYNLIIANLEETCEGKITCICICSYTGRALQSIMPG